jgi:hypothetical protein
MTGTTGVITTATWATVATITAGTCTIAAGTRGGVVTTGGTGIMATAQQPGRGQSQGLQPTSVGIVDTGQGAQRSLRSLATISHRRCL